MEQLFSYEGREGGVFCVEDPSQLEGRELHIGRGLSFATLDAQLSQGNKENIFDVLSSPLTFYQVCDRQTPIIVNIHTELTAHDWTMLWRLLFRMSAPPTVYLVKGESQREDEIQLCAAIHKLDKMDAFIYLQEKYEQRKTDADLLNYWGFKTHVQRKELTNEYMHQLPSFHFDGAYQLWFEFAQMATKDTNDCSLALRAYDQIEDIIIKETMMLQWCCVMNGRAFIEALQGNVKKAIKMEEEILSSCEQQSLDPLLYVQTLINLYQLYRKNKYEQQAAKLMQKMASFQHETNTFYAPVYACMIRSELEIGSVETAQQYGMEALGRQCFSDELGMLLMQVYECTSDQKLHNAMMQHLPVEQLARHHLLDDKKLQYRWHKVVNWFARNEEEKDGQLVHSGKVQ
ncbi:hypothetical protein NSQ26_01320 [Bacillus sp. FSL W7-1360]